MCVWETQFLISFKIMFCVEKTKIKSKAVE